MAAVTLTITLPDHEAQALAIIAASLGPEQLESAYQHWLNHWKANDVYSPQVEANMIDVMGEAAEKLLRGARRCWFRCSVAPRTPMTISTRSFAERPSYRHLVDERWVIIPGAGLVEAL